MSIFSFLSRLSGNNNNTVKTVVPDFSGSDFHAPVVTPASLFSFLHSFFSVLSNPSQNLFKEKHIFLGRGEDNIDTSNRATKEVIHLQQAEFGSANNSETKVLNTGNGFDTLILPAKGAQHYFITQDSDGFTHLFIDRDKNGLTSNDDEVKMKGVDLIQGGPKGDVFNIVDGVVTHTSAGKVLTVSNLPQIQGLGGSDTVNVTLTNVGNNGAPFGGAGESATINYNPTPNSITSADGFNYQLTATGGDGADGLDEGNGGNAGDATILAQNFTQDGSTSTGTQTLKLELDATGGSGGSAGGPSEDDGGAGGDALATAESITQTGGSGDNTFILTVNATGNPGGESGEGMTLDGSGGSGTATVQAISQQGSGGDDEMNITVNAESAPSNNPNNLSGSAIAQTGTQGSIIQNGGAGSDQLTVSFNAVGATGPAGNTGIFATEISIDSLQMDGGSGADTLTLILNVQTYVDDPDPSDLGQATINLSNITMSGDDDNDTFALSVTSQDTELSGTLNEVEMLGGTGADTLDLSGTYISTKVDLSLGTLELDGLTGTITLISIESLGGSTQSDTFTGRAGVANNFIATTDGSVDTIIGFENGRDKIDLSNLGISANEFNSTVSIVEINGGADTRIQLNADGGALEMTYILDDFNSADGVINANDFIFA